jgi:hypothetical protein
MRKRCEAIQAVPGARYVQLTGVKTVREPVATELGSATQFWPNRDPINEFGHQRATSRIWRFRARGELNLYRFVRGNPTRFVDRYGLCAKDCSPEDIAGVAVFMGNAYQSGTRCSGVEFGGLLCCDRTTGRAYSGTVVTGDEGQVDWRQSKCKEGDQEVGLWHTHPPRAPRQHPVRPGRIVASPDREWVNWSKLPSFMTNAAGETTVLRPGGGPEEVFDTNGWGRWYDEEE